MHSWLEAIARRYRITVRELLPALGLESQELSTGAALRALALVDTGFGRQVLPPAV
jgi:hypothetical protein